MIKSSPDGELGLVKDQFLPKSRFYKTEENKHQFPKLYALEIHFTQNVNLRE